MNSWTRRSFGFAALAAMANIATPHPASARDPSLLRFQTLWLNDPEFLGYMLAIDRGYYRRRRIEVEYLPGGPNIIPEGALISGKADVALTQMLTTAVAVIKKGAPLKIIGVQYQKSPLGIITLASSGISVPTDLSGKVVAVPTLCTEIFRAFVKLHDLTGKVKTVPYTFNPTPLIDGTVDATVDFVTQVPFIIKQKFGKETQSLLFDENGLPLFVDLLTVTQDVLKTRREELVSFIRASREGWVENFKDPTAAVMAAHDTWFRGTGTSIEAEQYFNAIQPSLMNSPTGLFSLSEGAIEANLVSLAKLGINATADLFDTSVVRDAA